MGRHPLQCDCEIGGDCTKTTMCAIQSAVEDRDEEIERLTTEVRDLQEIHVNRVRECERLEAALREIAEGEPGVPYSCIDKRAIALAALKGTDDE